LRITDLRGKAGGGSVFGLRVGRTAEFELDHAPVHQDGSALPDREPLQFNGIELSCGLGEVAGPQQDDPALAAAPGQQFRVVTGELARLGKPTRGCVESGCHNLRHREGEQAGDPDRIHLVGGRLAVEQRERPS
jgi:hypothetical protein